MGQGPRMSVGEGARYSPFRRRGAFSSDFWEGILCFVVRCGVIGANIVFFFFCFYRRVEKGGIHLPRYNVWEGCNRTRKLTTKCLKWETAIAISTCLCSPILQGDRRMRVLDVLS